MAGDDARDFLKPEEPYGLDRDHAVDNLAIRGDDRRPGQAERGNGLHDLRHMLRFDLAYLALGRAQR
jgi:hypothetical protein